MANLNRLTATEAARKLATREITAAALLTDCLERIAEREPTVHAWTFVDAEGAMQRARALDAKASTGLLHGLPIGVKDLFDTFDMPTSYGSPIYANHRPAADASSVALTRAAGGVGGGEKVGGVFPLASARQRAGRFARRAAYCGVVGYKPTYATINRVGAKMISDTLDTVG